MNFQASFISGAEGSKEGASPETLDAPFRRLCPAMRARQPTLSRRMAP